MCVVSTELSYGTLIRCFDLAVAARAHEELLGPVLAVRMIAQRQRDGTLMTEDGEGRMEKLPSEVWSMMRREAVKGALARGKESELKNWGCGACANACDCPLSYDCPNGPSYPRSSEWTQPECEECFEEMIWNDSPRPHSIARFDLASIDQLLGEYGLKRMQELDKTLVDDGCLFDFDAAYLVGRPTEDADFISTTIHHDELHRMQSQTQVPTLVRDVPTDDRLRALVSDYQIPASKATIPTYPGYTSTADKRGGGTWTMWTTCEPCMY